MPCWSVVGIQKLEGVASENKKHIIDGWPRFCKLPISSSYLANQHRTNKLNGFHPSSGGLHGGKGANAVVDSVRRNESMDAHKFVLNFPLQGEFRMT